MAPHTSDDVSKYPEIIETPDNRRMAYPLPRTTSPYTSFPGSFENQRVVYTPTTINEYPPPPVGPYNRALYTPSNSGLQYQQASTPYALFNNGSQYPNPPVGPDTRTPYAPSLNSVSQYPTSQEAPESRPPYTSNDGAYAATPKAPNSCISNRTAIGESQYPSDNRESHYTSNNEQQYSADNRMALPSSYNGSQHYPPLPAVNYQPQHGLSPRVHTSNGHPELQRSPPYNGTQHSGVLTAPPPAFSCPHSRGNQASRPHKSPSPPPTVEFKQSAPRQRTAIACCYCRKRKIRCTGFNADGTSGKCENCERTRQPCIFTPVSSQQTFVPLQAAIYAANGGLGPNTQLYGAHGQPLQMAAPLAESNRMFNPPQSNIEPQSPYNHQQVHRPSHPLDLASPMGPLDSQSRKRPADEQHSVRLPPPFLGVPSVYQREESFLERLRVAEDEPYRSILAPLSAPTYSQNYGYQPRETPLPQRQIEDSRQLAPVRQNEAPRTSLSPNGSSSLIHSQRPNDNSSLAQSSLSTHGTRYHPLSTTPPAGASSSERQNLMATLNQSSDSIASSNQRSDPMAIANFVDNRNIDEGMLGRLGHSWKR